MAFCNTLLHHMHPSMSNMQDLPLCPFFLLLSLLLQLLGLVVSRLLCGSGSLLLLRELAAPLSALQLRAEHDSRLAPAPQHAHCHATAPTELWSNQEHHTGRTLWQRAAFASR